MLTIINDRYKESSITKNMQANQKAARNWKSVSPDELVLLPFVNLIRIIIEKINGEEIDGSGFGLGISAEN